MRYWVALLPFVLSACALQPPKPSMWQLANECAATHPLGEVQSCTRYSLDANYGPAWHSAPQAYAFLDFIGATADHVNRGVMTEADGRLAVSNYAAQQSVSYQATVAAEAQEQAANLELGLRLMQQSRGGGGGVSGDAPFCMVYAGGTQCYYYTLPACQAMAQGAGGGCVVRPQ